MKIGFFANLDRDLNGVYTKKLINFVIEKGHTPIIDESIHHILDKKTMNQNIELYDAFYDSHFVIVVGGDGTVLRACQKACEYETKMLCINAGSLGFLTDCSIEHAEESIQKVIDGYYTVENRMMLECFLDEKRFLALNEIVISKANFSISTIKAEMLVNNRYMNSYVSDGVIASTPTGSTAYSYSAGGPLLKSDSKMIVVTPICSHDLCSRSLVLSSDDKITFKVNSKRKDALLLIDGLAHCQVGDGDVASIKSSHLFSSIIKTHKESSFEILRKKIGVENR